MASKNLMQEKTPNGIIILRVVGQSLGVVFGLVQSMHSMVGQNI
jgi:hypothetical protein